MFVKLLIPLFFFFIFAKISNHPMRRFFKRKLAENSDEVSDEIPQGHETSDEETQAPLTNSTALVVQQRAESESYLSMGLT